MQFKTEETYFGEMMGMLRERSGVAISEHSEPAMRLHALASELEALGATADWIMRQSFPQSADGQRLDRHAELRGLVRMSGTHAGGEVRFFTDGGAEVTVPAGTVVMSASLRRFVTDEALVVPEGAEFGDVHATAEAAGSDGNAAAGEICLMAAAPTGVISVVNPAKFVGGGERESDSSLRERLMASYRMVRGGANAAYYQALALGVDGVAAATVFPRPYGRGTVGIYAASEGGLLTAEVRQALRDKLNAEREIAVDISLLNPTVDTVDLHFRVYVHPGADVDAIRAGVMAALGPLYGGHTLGRPIYSADVIAAVNSVEGVVSATAVGELGDRVQPRYKLALLGSVTLDFEEI